MRFQFRNILWGMSIWTLILLAGCKREINTTTRVHPDGSFERTVTLRGDSSEVISGTFPVPSDSTWSIVKKNEGTEGEKKFVLTAEKTFRNARDLNAELKQKKDSVLQVQISIVLNKRFRWFNTFYAYREIYKASTPYLAVPISDYLTPKELELYCQMVDTLKKDTLGIEKKINEWGGSNIMENFYRVLFHEAEIIKDPALTPQTIAAKREDLFYAIRRDSSLDLGKNERILQILEKVYKTKSVRKLSGAIERSAKEFIRNEEFLMRMESDSYTNQIIMPGIILDTNAQTVDGNKAVWKFTGRRFIWADYEMRVESRVVNRWAIYVSAGLLLLVFTGIGISLFKR